MNIGRYRVVGELGRGAMGVVYRAHDPNLDRDVALKALREDRGVDEAFMKRFMAEARALGRLDHPGIVRVFNVDEDAGTVYIAMEFVEGESLDAVMRKRRFSPEEIVEVGVSVAEALDYAHGKGIVHRDIKPSNILIRPDGRLKLTDFGIARIEDPSAQTMTQAGEILGTPAYMSPEQVLSRPVDGRSDLFSLGIILHELCAGKRPFGGESLGAVFNAITREEPPRIADANPDIPEGLTRVVGKCLMKEPAERYTSGAALAEALKGGLAGRAPGSSAASPAAGARSKGAVLALAALGIAAAGGGAAFYHFRQAPGTPSPAASSGAAAPSAATPAVVSPAAPAGPTVLRVESEPPGARVHVDGADRGGTPVAVPASPGKHEVRVILAGHNDWEAQVELREGVDTPLSVRLAPFAAPRRETPPARGAARPPADASVAEDLEAAIRSYERGQLDVSITMLESVLRRDGENRRAREYLDKARAQRSKVLEEWKKDLEDAPVTGGRKR